MIKNGKACKIKRFVPKDILGRLFFGLKTFKQRPHLFGVFMSLLDAAARGFLGVAVPIQLEEAPGAKMGPKTRLATCFANVNINWDGPNLTNWFQIVRLMMLAAGFFSSKEGESIWGRSTSGCLQIQSNPVGCFARVPWRTWHQKSRFQAPISIPLWLWIATCSRSILVRINFYLFFLPFLSCLPSLPFLPFLLFLRFILPSVCIFPFSCVFVFFFFFFFFFFFSFPLYMSFLLSLEILIISLEFSFYLIQYNNISILSPGFLFDLWSRWSFRRCPEQLLQLTQLQRRDEPSSFTEGARPAGFPNGVLEGKSCPEKSPVEVLGWLKHVKTTETKPLSFILILNVMSFDKVWHVIWINMTYNMTT